MAYSAVVRAIVNEFERIYDGHKYDNDVAMELVSFMIPLARLTSGQIATCPNHVGRKSPTR